MRNQLPLESRLCVVCGATYTPRQDRQLVCQNKACKHKYKRKQAREYAKEKRKVVLVNHAKRPCSECGKAFKPKRINTVTCSTECQEKRKRHLMENNANIEIYSDTIKIRPYTSTSTMTIVSDLMRNKSLKDIATVLGRDLKDLKQHIAEIEASGTKLKWEQRLRAYREI